MKQLSSSDGTRANLSRNRPVLRRRGASLIELLCVIAIISILMSLYLTAVFGAFKRILAFIESLQS